MGFIDIYSKWAVSSLIAAATNADQAGEWAESATQQ